MFFFQLETADILIQSLNADINSLNGTIREINSEYLFEKKANELLQSTLKIEQIEKHRINDENEIKDLKERHETSLKEMQIQVISKILPFFK